MSEVRDKRRKSDLDLFVLALIGGGVSTAYALQKEAGLSPGATIPAIQRMLDEGLLRQGKPGRRGRTDCRITPAGKKRLKDGWQTLIHEGPSGDLDADLRVALLAISEGKAYSSAVQLLKRTAVELHEMSQADSPGAESAPPVTLAELYRSLRSVSVKAILEAQGAAAVTIAGSLPRKLAMTAKKAATPYSEGSSQRRIKRLE